MNYLKNWKLNENKTYYETQKFLYNSQIDIIHNILNSPLYKHLQEKGFKYNENLYISPIQSMCMETQPDSCRIRNDKFLKQCKQKKKVGLLSAININGKIIYLLFFLK